MSKKTGKFKFEIRLGLTLIILVLMILNFASFYAIFRVEKSLEIQLKDKLSEASIVAVNTVDRLRTAEFPDTVITGILDDYTLSNISIIHMNYERVLIIQGKQKLDSTFLDFDSTITSEIISPVLHNEMVFYHKSGDRKYSLFFPFAHAGSKYLIAVSKNSSLLGSLENVERILIFFGILGLIIILYVASRFIKQVISPFKYLKEKAEKSGRFEQSASDEVSQVISSYEKIINELRQKERELNRRMELLGEMSGGLAHQLRNSIAAIIGFGRMIQKKAYGQDIVQHNIEYLLKESREAEELVARFLDFARPLQLSSSEFEINDLIANIVSSTSKKFNNVNIVSESLTGQPIYIYADYLLLKQAVSNLIDNACKAFNDIEGSIRIKINASGRMLKLLIMDNGPGIPDEYQDKIFTPFFSGSPSGTGLGLPLTQKIITLHKGRLTFESTPGIGTTFIITLPKAIVEKKAAVITDICESDS